MKINYFNADHTHALFDLPTSKSIEQVVQLFKCDSSHWINENKLIRGRFAWGRGYGAFSVSHSDVPRVAAYIAGLEEHHKKKTFAEEYELFVKRYGLEWRSEKTVKTVEESIRQLSDLVPLRSQPSYGLEVESSIFRLLISCPQTKV